MAGFYEWRVKATINGKRIITAKDLFRTKLEANEYAKRTNKERPGANARVVQVLRNDSAPKKAGAAKRSGKRISGTGDVYEYTVPVWALGCIVNGDASGLTDEEISRVQIFEANVYKETGSSITMGSGLYDEPYFSRRNDIDGNLGGDVVDVSVRSRK